MVTPGSLVCFMLLYSNAVYIFLTEFEDISHTVESLKKDKLQNAYIKLNSHKSD